MLKLIVSDKPVEVNFTHYDNVSAPWTLCHVVTPEKTYCGSAYCHAGDQYNRNTGRKISLSRALFNAFPYDNARVKLCGTLISTSAARWNNGIIILPVRVRTGA